MRRVHESRFSAFQAGLIAIVVIVVAVFFAFTKDIPFTKPYELKATFENAPPIQKNQAVTDGTYARADRSLNLPLVKLEDLEAFLEANHDDETHWIKGFRKWVRERVVPPTP